MDILTKSEVFNIVKDLENVYNGITKKSNLIYDTFNALMKEEKHMDKTKDLQERFVTTISQQFALPNVTMEEVSRSFRDLKNYSYFDNFMRKGFGNEVISVLNKYGLSSSILSGLNPNVPFHINEDGVEVIQQVEQQTEGESPVITYFAIKVNGKTVVEFSNERGKFLKQIDYIKEEIEEFFGEESVYFDEDKIGKNKTKSVYAFSIDDVSVWIGKNDRISFRRKGKFVSKGDIM